MIIVRKRVWLTFLPSLTYSKIFAEISFYVIFKHPFCMQLRAIFSLILFAWFGFLPAQAGFNREAFYKVMMGHSISEIDKTLNNPDLKDKRAFKGALLMKKSGFLTQAKEKLGVFRLGIKELESSIVKDSSNAEYRFLRLMIQENAPGVVNYNREIKKDASYLRKNYKNLPPATQKALLDYSKTSKELKPEDFKNEVHE